MAVADVETQLRWDRLELRETIVRSEKVLPNRQVKVEGILDKNGSVTLSVDGEIVGKGKREHALSVYPAGILNAGTLPSSGFLPVGDAALSETFPGVIQDIRVEFGDKKG